MFTKLFVDFMEIRSMYEYEFNEIFRNQIYETVFSV